MMSNFWDDFLYDVRSHFLKLKPTTFEMISFRSYFLKLNSPKKIELEQNPTEEEEANAYHTLRSQTEQL